MVNLINFLSLKTLEMPGKLRLATPEKSYIGTSISRDLADRVRRYCVLNAKTLRQVLEEALEEYLEKRGGRGGGEVKPNA